jgi:hypothetical protein
MPVEGQILAGVRLAVGARLAVVGQLLAAEPVLAEERLEVGARPRPPRLAPR